MTAVNAFEARLRAAIPASFIIVLASLFLPLHSTLLFDLAIPSKSIETGAVLLAGVIVATACAAIVTTTLRSWLVAAWVACRADVELPNDPNRRELDAISAYFASGHALVVYSALWTPALLLVLVVINAWLALAAFALVATAAASIYLRFEVAGMLVARIAGPVALTIGLALIVYGSASPGVLIGSSLLTGLTVTPVVALVSSRAQFLYARKAYLAISGCKANARDMHNANITTKGLQIVGAVAVSTLFMIGVMTARITPALVVACRGVSDQRDRTIKASASGKVVEVLVQDGARVNSGAALIVLDTVEATVTLASARTRLVDARLDLQSAETHRAETLQAFGSLQSNAEDRVKRRLSSTQELDEVRARRIAEQGQSLAQLAAARSRVAELEAARATAQAALDAHTISAPGPGTITQMIGLDVGSQIGTGDVVGSIVSGGKARVECRVSDRDRADLSRADGFEVRPVLARDRYVASTPAHLATVSPTVVEFKNEAAFIATFAIDGTGVLMPGDAAELTAKLPSIRGWEHWLMPIMRAVNRGAQ